MTALKKYQVWSVLLFVALIFLFFYDLTLGSFSISINDVFNSIFGEVSSTTEMTLRVFRFPRVVMAILGGAALSVSGLLMQTLFQNPLAGPYVLGINSGAALFVAISTMTSLQLFGENIGIISAALLGAFISGLLILFSSFYVKNKVSLLLIGIMLGSFVAAAVNVVQSYSEPDNLKKFMLWSFGSLQGVEHHQIGTITFVVATGIAFSFLLAKPLNILLLGDKNAKILGVNIRGLQLMLIFITALLTGVITAFCGPIAFVGLIIPNMIKSLYKTANHFHLLIGCIFGGALLLLLCDIAMQLLSPFINLPLNALTALIGAPVVIWIIVKKF